MPLLLRSTWHPQSSPLVLPFPFSKSVSVHRDDGSMNNIRRSAGRVSRGKRRKMDSPPPAWKVATLSVRWRRLTCTGPVVGGMTVFSVSITAHVGAGVTETGGITVVCSIAAAIETIGEAAAFTALARGVGRSS